MMNQVKIALLCLLATGIVFSCQKQKQEEERERPRQEEEQPAEPRPLKLGVDFHEEVFGDPTIFNAPRLQFWWEPPGTKRYSAWTVRLDGSDLRRTADEKLLYLGDETITQDPARSPDNRYLIFPTMNHKHEKILIDLKERTRKVIAEGGGRPSFQWLPDSTGVLFYLDGDLIKYEVATGKISMQPEIVSYDFYLLPEKNQIAAIRAGRVEFYSWDAKLLRTVEIGWDFSFSRNAGTISRDGALLVLMGRVFRLGNKPELLFNGHAESPSIRLDDPAVGPKNKVIFHGTGEHLHEFSIANPKDRKIRKLPGGRPCWLTLINL
jgi:hypothetical protein